MLSNIIVAIMCVIMVAAGIFGWWWENGGCYRNSEKDEEKPESEIETDKTEGNRYKFHVRDNSQNGKSVQVSGGYSRYDDFVKGMAKTESELGSYSCHE